MSPNFDARQRYDVDQVRERTDLVALIGQQVVLKKRGNRYVGLCPFHQEKTPSFGVDAQKGFWHCFGCGKGGDAFNFVMELEKLTFPEAVERLAERAGVRPVETTFDAPKRKEERDLLFEVNAAAAGSFRSALKGKAGEVTRRYLADRGMTPAAAERFGLGYAPGGWDALISHLQQRSFSVEIMAKAGLALARSSGSGYVDRFRNRLMIPIHDRQGRVVAFGGRALNKDDQPKYLNTAETPIFHKGRTLYALHLAADAIGKRGRAIVTEGYFDAIACHLAGFTEAVATLGTALGEEHVQLLRRLVGDGQILLVFDADSAGINAALRSQALFREADVDVRIVLLPTGHDPDTLIREGGAAAFEQCLTDALSPVMFELDRLLQRNPARDAEGRVRLFREAARILQPLSGLARSEYIARFIERLPGGQHENPASLQQAVLSEVAALDRAPRRRMPVMASEPPPDEETARPSYPEAPLEREVMTAVVQDADFARRAILAVPPEAFSHPGYRLVFHGLARQVAAGADPDPRRVVTEDESTAAIVAALAVRDMLPIQDLLERLCDEYEARLLRPQTIDLDDRAAAEAFTANLRKRSQRNSLRGGYEES